MKNCPKCGKTKPLTDFGKNSRYKSGRQSYCRVCMNVESKKWNKDHRKRYLENQRKNRLVTLPARAENQRRYRSSKNAQTGWLPDGYITRLYEEQRGLCGYCWSWIEPQPSRNHTHVDHVVPISEGGLHDWTNVVLACRWCNFSKGSKLNIYPRGWVETLESRVNELQSQGREAVVQPDVRH